MPASYLQEAFGTFAPHTDKEAAVKFALDLAPPGTVWMIRWTRTMKFLLLRKEGN
jgi:hypothetical protein